MKISHVVVLLVALLLSGVAVLVAVWVGRERNPPPAPTTAASAVPQVSSAFTYQPTAIGAPVSAFGRPLVTHVNLADLDQDGLLDVLYCEGHYNTVRWIRQHPRGAFTESILGEVRGPVHVEGVDFTGDGQLDLLVAGMGLIPPNNDRIGTAVVLENRGDGTFVPRTLLERVARVTDVRAADFTGDGRLDLVVGQFGYHQGEIQWLENLGEGKFRRHPLLTLSGTIHTPMADFDGDGRPDIAALVSQEWEEVHLFRNQGSGRFAAELVWGSTNEDFGSSGLAMADLNQDGRPDLVCTNGDGFDYAGSGFRRWHGVQWLENLGDGRFQYHRIGDLPGAYAPHPADLDGDGDLDVVTTGGFADWQDPESVSLVAWINDGTQQFQPVILAHRPTHLVTAAVGDLDGTGTPVIVTGGWHLFPPYEHLSSVTVWRRQ